jgi:hypothetical protein
MTLSLNCKDAGDPVCTHTMTGEQKKNYLPMQRSMVLKSTDILKKLGMKRFQKTRSTLEV